MNDRELDHLLEQKKTQRYEKFSVSRDEFKTQFFKTMRMESRESSTQWKGLAFAALLVFVAFSTMGLAMLLSILRNIPQAPSPVPFALAENPGLAYLSETSRFLGNDTGFVYYNGELIVGERVAKGERKNQFLLTIHEESTNKEITIAFSAADEETIILDSPLLSGVILLTKSDANTFIAEVNLKAAHISQPFSKVVVMHIDQPNQLITSVIKLS